MIALTWDRTWDLYIWALFTSPSGMNSALKIRRRGQGLKVDHEHTYLLCQESNCKLMVFRLYKNVSNALLILFAL